jgi:CheY-like chemotaxis protein
MHPRHRPSQDPPDDSGEAAVVRPALRQYQDKLGVLVVDDDHLVRILVQMGLERDGFDVWLAASGREAINVYREHREDIAVVLLDVRMPGMDGPQTLDALRELNPEVLACFMSGNAGGYGPDELRERGAAHIIDKPFLLKNLADVLRAMARDGHMRLCAPSGMDLE